MKISIYHNIMWSKYKGGVFSAIHKQTHGSDTSVSFTQIAETEGDRIALGGVDISYHQYPYRLLFNGSYGAIPTGLRIRALMNCAWNDQADIVVIAGYDKIEYWAMLAILILRRKSRAVFCDSTIHDRPRKLITSIAKRIFFSLCNGFFAYGIRSKEYLMSYGVPSRKIFFRCQAAALALNYTEQTAHQARISNSTHQPDAPHFIYVGRLSHEKGLDTLIKATEQVRLIHPKVLVDLIGAGPMKDELTRLIDTAGLAGNIQLVGSMNISQLSVQYSTATAMILPSTSEPWGLVVNEAMSHGCPCIVSHTCGCVPELIIDAKTGFSFQTGSVKDLKDKMLASLDAFSNREKTSRNCIKHMQNYMPDRAAKQILDGCRDILSGASS